MDLPATDPPPATRLAGDDAVGRPAWPERNEQPEWLVDADDPLLTADRMARVADPSRPDRLTWNTFRTLAVWDTDLWVPRVLSVACGPDNPLSPLDWGGASVIPWAVGPFGGEAADDIADVVIDGPEAYVVLACTIRSDPREEMLRAAALAALYGSLHGGRQAGFVVVAPTAASHVSARLEVATDIELRDGRLASDLLAGATGSISWPDLGRLALDLAEEADPDTVPGEVVHQLVTELQALFPDATI
jgi:hypothetical protein